MVLGDLLWKGNSTTKVVLTHRLRTFAIEPPTWKVEAGGHTIDQAQLHRLDYMRLWNVFKMGVEKLKCLLFFSLLGQNAWLEQFKGLLCTSRGYSPRQEWHIGKSRGSWLPCGHRKQSCEGLWAACLCLQSRALTMEHCCPKIRLT